MYKLKLNVTQARNSKTGNPILLGDVRDCIEKWVQANEEDVVVFSEETHDWDNIELALESWSKEHPWIEVLISIVGEDGQAWFSRICNGRSWDVTPTLK